MRRLRITRLNWDREGPPGPTEFFPGDVCPENCRDGKGRPGLIGVYATVHGEFATTRYLHCTTCGWLPENKLVEPLKPGDQNTFRFDTTT